MQKDQIKVTAPANNPHICYIPKEMEKHVKIAKKKCGKSMYRIICESVGMTLSSKEKIHECKKMLKDLGYKTIGDWVTVMLTLICDTGKIPEPFKKQEE